MPGDTPETPAATPLTAKERWILWLQQQGVAIVVLILTNLAFGYYIYKIDPENDAKRDAAFLKELGEFRTELADQQKRQLEYRTKADDKRGEEIRLLIADGEKQYNRLERLMLEVRSQAASTGRKVDAALSQ